jgi:hypothetical protein
VKKLKQPFPTAITTLPAATYREYKDVNETLAVGV